jgi:hypothetical protein|tara:strand:- start:2003 stop:2320 length:318 start_codon:yes stop_codon:yes gene_type:complete
MENRNRNNIYISKVLCIPRVSRFITSGRIQEVIKHTKIGNIYAYKEIPLKNEKDFKRVLFSIEWNQEHAQIENIKYRIENKESLKIVYDFPWYWIVVTSKIQKID